MAVITLLLEVSLFLFLISPLNRDMLRVVRVYSILPYRRALSMVTLSLFGVVLFIFALGNWVNLH